MSPEISVPREIKKEEKNIINIFTTDKAALEKLCSGDGKDIHQIPIMTGTEAQAELEKSLANGKEPQWLVQVTLKKAKNQGLEEIKKEEVWAPKQVWKYYRGKEKKWRDRSSSFLRLFFPCRKKFTRDYQK